MIRSKFIPTILAAFCSLAAQLHTSGANAQEFYAFIGFQLPGPGWGVCSDGGYCLWMLNDGWDDGTAGLVDPNGHLYFQTQQAWQALDQGDPDSWLIFQNDGNLVVYDQFCIGGCWQVAPWATNTYAGNTSTGLPGYAIKLDDQGNFTMYDYDFNFIMCIWCNP